MSVSRREFIQNASIGVAACAAAGANVRSEAAAVKSGTLEVLLLLEGGIDPLSVLVPLRCERYRAARPSIAIEPRRALPLDSQWGLHPALECLHSQWTQGALQLMLIQTETHSSHVQATENFAREYMAAESEPGAEGAPHARPTIIADARSLTSHWQAARRLRWTQHAAGRQSQEIFVAGLARLMEIDTSSRLVLALSDFDCHADAVRRQPALFKRLDQVTLAITQALEMSGRLAPCALSLCSELGRAFEENSRGGTDHGEFFLAARGCASSSSVVIAESFEPLLS